MILKKLFKSAVPFLVASAVVSGAFAAQPSDKLLDPKNHTLIMLDHQPQMAFAAHSMDVGLLRNNSAALVKSAVAFKVPVILTTVAEKQFSGPIFPEIQAVLPKQKPIDRSTMNAWEDKRVVDEVKKLGKKKLVMAGLWTEICVLDPVLSAIQDGYDVYVVTDASAGVSKEAHDMAVTRMVQAGAQPITWLQYLLELQRDWARGETYNAVAQISVEHGGGYGLGLVYAKEMLNANKK